MEVIKYKSMADDLYYWSNSLGELHYHGKYGIEKEDLPQELQRAYSVLWSGETGSYCYLVEYRSKYGIALINEFDAEFASINNLSMSELFEVLSRKADVFAGMEEFSTATIVVSEYSGFDDSHELIVILPTDTEKSVFDRVCKILHDKCFTL